MEGKQTLQACLSLNALAIRQPTRAEAGSAEKIALSVTYTRISPESETVKLVGAVTQCFCYLAQMQIQSR
jgi:hypothetical protein